MPLVNLNNNLLRIDGILEKLKALQSDLDKIPANSLENSTQKKIDTLRENLKKIYFEGMNEKAIATALNSTPPPHLTQITLNCRKFYASFSQVISYLP